MKAINVEEENMEGVGKEREWKWSGAVIFKGKIFRL